DRNESMRKDRRPGAAGRPMSFLLQPPQRGRAPRRYGQEQGGRRAMTALPTSQLGAACCLAAAPSFRLPPTRQALLNRERALYFAPEHHFGLLEPWSESYLSKTIRAMCAWSRTPSRSRKGRDLP